MMNAEFAQVAATLVASDPARYLPHNHENKHAKDDFFRAVVSYLHATFAGTVCPGLSALDVSAARN